MATLNVPVPLDQRGGAAATSARQRSPLAIYGTTASQAELDGNASVAFLAPGQGLLEPSFIVSNRGSDLTAGAHEPLSCRTSGGALGAEPLRPLPRSPQTETTLVDLWKDLPRVPDSPMDNALRPILSDPTAVRTLLLPEEVTAPAYEAAAAVPSTRSTRRTSSRPALPSEWTTPTVAEPPLGPGDRPAGDGLPTAEAAVVPQTLPPPRIVLIAQASTGSDSTSKAPGAGAATALQPRRSHESTESEGGASEPARSGSDGSAAAATTVRAG